MNISIKQAVGIYQELVEALHNKNGFGGDTAEIYAYRLMPYRPSEHTIEDAINAAKSLVDLIELFIEANDCKVTINELTPKTWLEQVGDSYTHRVHVRVESKK